jgi:hypothetical protein
MLYVVVLAQRLAQSIVVCVWRSIGRQSDIVVSTWSSRRIRLVIEADLVVSTHVMVHVHVDAWFQAELTSFS